MKTPGSLRYGLWLFLLVTGSSSAVLPDFEKEYKEKGLASIHEINGTRIVRVATNDTFEFVRLSLEKLLGEEWVEVPLQDSSEKKKGVFPVSKTDQDPKRLGMARFENPKHKGVFINLVLMDLPLGKMGYTAVITVVERR